MESSDELFREGCRLMDHDAEQAIARFRRAIEISPDLAEAHTNLGILLQKGGKPAQAEATFRLSLIHRPQSPETLSNLAALLAESKRFEEAEALYRQSISMRPLPAALSNYGTLLASLKRDAEAESCFRASLELDPENPNTRFNFAYLLLSQGCFTEGWEFLEARHFLGIVEPNFPFPKWKGEPLSGKSILILPEFGLGDEIQFCRYVPLLRKAGASKIVLVCRKALEPLFETLHGIDAVFSEEEGIPVENFDYWTQPLSIPRHFGAPISCEIPYLFAVRERVEKWKNRIPHGKLKVGLAWKGNPLHENDENRSLASLLMLAPLWEAENASFCSLQKGEGEKQAKFFPLPLAPLGSEIDDFADTAAILSMLDLVICVDTAIAHVAGAMGKPCWLMLPEFRTDWRWLKKGSDSPWYPTLRLFRQGRDNQWAPVILEIRNALIDQGASLSQV